ncbi:MAG: ABC transporter ATP-binding protein [Nitrosomonadales bacterium]|nr:MAG: ABC transporter ATP-binding protein [Nitrosomonadales bacterium]
MSSDIAIKVENLSKCFHIYDKPRDRVRQLFARGDKKYYREFWALKEVSFEIKKGETVGIIGRNGSGKSTLLQIICGTLTPTSGTVETHGRIAALLELGSGFNPEFTGRENVYMNGAVLGLSKQEIDAKFDDIAAFADIGDFIEQPVKTYSSGMMVRLAFAVIAHVDADILVVDEALAVGDAVFTQKCMRFLRGFMQRGALLFVSHDSAAVMGLCSLAVWLQTGSMRMLGDAKTVCEAYLASTYIAIHGGQEQMIVAGNGETKTKQAIRDVRADIIDRSTLRNDIRVFCFDPEAARFGLGGAEIVDVGLFNAVGERIGWVVGGETVHLRIHCVLHEPMASPIVGFLVKDRLGQALFGDNTYLSYATKPVSVAGGDNLTTEFVFQMPILPAGDFTVTVSIADGSQHDHVQHQWIHDAMVFQSVSSSVCSGLVGIPMMDISMSKK